MPAGYSGTPLAKKLGIKEAHRVVLLDEPKEFRSSLDDLPDGVTFAKKLGSPADVIVTFITERSVLEHHIDDAAADIFPAGAIWVAWPKKASKVPTDMTEDVVRELALPRNLVDNKVCAISEVWSGLRIVWRKEHRT